MILVPLQSDGDIAAIGVNRHRGRLGAQGRRGSIAYIKFIFGTRFIETSAGTKSVEKSVPSSPEMPVTVSKPTPLLLRANLSDHLPTPDVGTREYIRGGSYFGYGSLDSSTRFDYHIVDPGTITFTRTAHQQAMDKGYLYCLAGISLQAEQRRVYRPGSPGIDYTTVLDLFLIEKREDGRPRLPVVVAHAHLQVVFVFESGRPTPLPTGTTIVIGIAQRNCRRDNPLLLYRFNRIPRSAVTKQTYRARKRRPPRLESPMVNGSLLGIVTTVQPFAGKLVAVQDSKFSFSKTSARNPHYKQEESTNKRNSLCHRKYIIRFIMKLHYMQKPTKYYNYLFISCKYKKLFGINLYFL